MIPNADGMKAVSDSPHLIHRTGKYEEQPYESEDYRVRGMPWNEGYRSVEEGRIQAKGCPNENEKSWANNINEIAQYVSPHIIMYNTFCW